jgi:hypothetical protein
MTVKKKSNPVRHMFDLLLTSNISLRDMMPYHMKDVLVLLVLSSFQRTFTEKESTVRSICVPFFPRYVQKRMSLTTAGGK